MRRRYLFTALALIFGLLIFGYSQSPRRTSETPQTLPTVESINPEKVLSTQQRINRYFHDDVMTKLNKCWANVQGKGTIAFKYTYTKAGARWLFNRLETEQSTLPKGQDGLASKCMLNAVGASSFPIDTSEKSGNTFVVNWKWPVPFPANAGELTTSMFAMRVSNGTGASDNCDGSGTPAKCYTCDFGFNCKRVCVGYTGCTQGSGTDRFCIASGYCASGGPFGVIGVTRSIY